MQASFRDTNNTGRVRGYNYLPILCAARPVHVVFGAVDDYMCVGKPIGLSSGGGMLIIGAPRPREVKDRLLKEGMLQGYASVRRVHGAGHLVRFQSVGTSGCIE